jgi:hypothetical protein
LAKTGNEKGKETDKRDVGTHTEEEDFATIGKMNKQTEEEEAVGTFSKAAEEWMQKSKAVLLSIKKETEPYVKEVRKKAYQVIEDSPAMWEDLKKNGMKTYDDVQKWFEDLMKTDVTKEEA